MLKNTFIHVPGIGTKRELQIHRSGISTWREFLADPGKSGLSKSFISRTLPVIEESEYRLNASDAAFFESCLPSREKWRMWSEFSQDAVFLDIETTGMAAQMDYVTVAGLHDAEGNHAFIRGENLFLLPERLQRYKLVVTFNGSQFDLPFLRRGMGDIFSHMGHIDLRFALRRLGHGGGLKQIERKLGIARPDEISGMDGYEAVLMWRRYLRGDEKALESLIAYNSEDTRNLRPLMEISYEELRRRFFCMAAKKEPRPDTGAAHGM